MMKIVLSLCMTGAVAIMLAMAPFGIRSAVADCLSQCDAQQKTCERGCTTNNAKTCEDSCKRGYEGCKNRCSK